MGGDPHMEKSLLLGELSKGFSDKLRTIVPDHKLQLGRTEGPQGRDDHVCRHMHTRREQGQPQATACAIINHDQDRQPSRDQWRSVGEQGQLAAQVLTSLSPQGIFFLPLAHLGMSLGLVSLPLCLLSASFGLAFTPLLVRQRASRFFNRWVHATLGFPGGILRPACRALPTAGQAHFITVGVQFSPFGLFLTAAMLALPLRSPFDRPLFDIGAHLFLVRQLDFRLS